MTRRALAILSVAGLGLLVSSPADAGRSSRKRDKGPRVTAPNPVGPSVSPPANLFLRNSMDNDPSRYLGRFVTDGSAVLDESNSRKTRCSTLISYSEVGAAGLTVDELFRVSDKAAASLGIPAFGAAGTGSSESFVRIRYTQTKKMVSDIEDPGAFEDCCKAAPDQCTGRYVGEFIQGTGQFFYATGNAAEVNVGGAGGGVAGGLEVKHGMAWQRGMEMTQPIYFAFKTADSGWSGGGGGSAENIGDDWCDNLPRTTQGTYFCGISDMYASEPTARDAALLHARQQVLRWVEQSIAEGQAESWGVSQDEAGVFRKASERDGWVEASTSGVSSMVKDVRWKVERVPTPDGGAVQVRVLAFLPRGAYPDVVRAVTQTF